MAVLEEFVASFGGVLLLVSHDRYFLDTLVDKLFILPSDGSGQIKVTAVITIIPLREREREREARRETYATGSGNTPPTGDPHRGEDPAEEPPPEGRATQGTHTEHTLTDAFEGSGEPEVPLHPMLG